MKQYRIGILGTENSHALHYAAAFNKADLSGGDKYEGFRITALYGHYPEENRKIASEYGVDFIAENVEDMLGKVDAVIVCARDGKYHYEFAKPFIEAGLPVFLDKPTTIDVGETIELLSFAKQNNIPMLGGSVLKFTDTVKEMNDFVNKNKDTICGGFVAAPVLMENPYSGFYFYAAHLIEICLPVFGWNPISVSASVSKSGVVACVDYENYSVMCRFNDFCPEYSCGVFDKESSKIDKIDISKAQEAECDAFVDMVKTGKMSYSYEQFAMPIVLMNAIEEAYKTGKKVFVNNVEL